MNSHWDNDAPLPGLKKDSRIATPGERPGLQTAPLPGLGMTNTMYCISDETQIMPLWSFSPTHGTKVHSNRNIKRTPEVQTAPLPGLGIQSRLHQFSERSGKKDAPMGLGIS